MNAVLFRIVALAMWGVAIVVYAQAWIALSGKFTELGAAVIGAVAGFAVIVIQSKLHDALVPERAPRAEVSREDIEGRAERAAADALKLGNYARAIEVYENAGLLPQAIKAAQAINDMPSLVRLYHKRGQHDKARRTCLELGDLEGAAQASTLMGEMREARVFYKEAAEHILAEGRHEPAHVAGLLDRAGLPERAAPLYEEAGELEHAADCLKLAGETEKAERALEYARAMKAVRNREMIQGRGKVSGQSAANLRDEAVQGARLYEEIGDLLGAARFLAQAKQHLESAILLERWQDWERAAAAYDEAGMSDRAALARAKAPPRPVKPTAADATATAPPAAAPQTFVVHAPPDHAPSPATAPFSMFAALTEANAAVLPVHMAATTDTPMADDPETKLNIARRVRRGEFKEAAEFAETSGDWMMAAALHERAGDSLRAADLYRRIGRMEDALHCLLRADRPKEAALIALGAGEPVRAREMLAHALGQSTTLQSGGPANAHLEEAALLLADLHLKAKDPKAAAYTLGRHPALLPEGSAHADDAGSRARHRHSVALHWRASGALREAGAHAEAMKLLHALRAAGVRRRDVDGRIKALATRLGIDDGLPAAQPAYSWGIAAAAPAEAEDGQTAPLDAPPDEKDAAFADYDPDSVMLADPDGSVEELSLFGPPAEGVRRGSPTPARGGASSSRPSSSSSISLSTPGPDVDFDSTGDTPDRAGMAAAAAADNLDDSMSGDDDPFAGGHRYRIVREIARGGMGIVFEARDRVLGRTVALKVLKSPDGTDAPPGSQSVTAHHLAIGGAAAAVTPEAYRRFLLEARAVARLSHPNVVVIYDLGLLDARHYITMELLTGGTLHDWIEERNAMGTATRARRTQELAERAASGDSLFELPSDSRLPDPALTREPSGPGVGLPVRDAVRAVLECARGLAVAHKAGIVHRDIKPRNILLTDHRQAKITDFGLAKLIRNEDPGPGRPAVNGTPGYMSPEQIRGADPHPACDIYALGICLFQSLVGRPPHRVADKTTLGDVLRFQLAGKLPSIVTHRPDCPPVIDEIYQFCTQTEPQDRYQSVDAFLPTLEQWVSAV